MNTLKQLQRYMGNRRVLLPASLALSALSALLGMAPLVLIWRIVRELLVPESSDTSAFLRSCAEDRHYKNLA